MEPKKISFLVVALTLILFYSEFSPVEVFAQNIDQAGQKILNQYQTYKDTGITPIPSKSQSSSNYQPSTSNAQSSSIINSLSESGLISQDALIGLGIFIFIIIIIVAIAASRRGSPKSEYIPRRGFSPATKKQVKNRQHGRCVECGDYPTHWEFHHIGSRDDNDISNCQGLCRDCHQDKTLSEYN